MFAKQIKAPAVKIDAVTLKGGLDIVSPEAERKPGTCAFAINYEPLITGGYERLGGIERFDGHPSPHQQSYVAMARLGAVGDPAIGDTVTGATSGATGRVIVVDGDLIVLVRVTGAFTREEDLLVAGVSIGIYSPTDPTITALPDLDLGKAVENHFRADIDKVPGSGPIRGLQVFDDRVYAWRNNVAGTALVVHKSSPAGWVPLSLFRTVPFEDGTARFVVGETVTQGGTTALIKRVVLEGGDWLTGTARGRLVIAAPVGGEFSVGVATSASGSAKVTAASSAITLAPGGRVESVVTNFFGGPSTKAIYGCDGVNPEFELGADDILVPIRTGMTDIRASFVAVHKFQLFYFYLGSLQHSAPGDPHKWSVVVGAGELGTGDIGTGLLAVAGSESAGALLVYCKNSMWALYGNNSLDWNFQRLSDQAGAQAFSAQDVGAPIVYDNSGFRKTLPTQAFGNFAHELISSQIEPLVTNLQVRASVVVKSKGRYRVFFTDGTGIVGVPYGNGMAWMPIDYGARLVHVAIEGEISNKSRVFYGDDEGWVYEADVGRSNDGDAISCSVKLNALSQGSTLLNKQFRRCDIEMNGNSAFLLQTAFEFDDSDPLIDVVQNPTLQQLTNFGRAMVWGGSQWGRSYWLSGEGARMRVDCTGQGYAIAPLFGGSADNELGHRVTSVMLVYTPLRLAR